MTLEIYVLLYGLYPTSISEKTQSFWKTVDKFLSSKKGNWHLAYHLLCYEWRYDKSIVMCLYNYLNKNYPYPIPKTLFFSDDPSWLLKPISKKRKKYYKVRKLGGLAIEEFQIEDLANKWLRDYLSGESFFKRNKDFFTGNNANIFLNNKLQLDNDKSFLGLIKHYYSSKIYPVQKEDLLNVLAYKFKYCFNHPHVINFLTFISNNKIIPSVHSIQDICDYFINEVINSNQLDFSFKGRTWNGLKRASDEWHRFMQIPVSEYNASMDSSWDKLSDINDKIIKDREKTWEFKQITTGKLLYEEGKYMHHCCFTHMHSCVNGDSAIFSLRCYEENFIIREKSATIEITNEKYLLEARGQFNNEIDSETQKIIDIWKKENGIKDNKYVNDEFFLNNENNRYNENNELFINNEYYKSRESFDNYYEYKNEYENYNENDDGEIEES